MNELDKPLLVSSGEPAGIGPDICLALQNKELPWPIVILGDYKVFEQRARQLGLNFDIPAYNAQYQQKLSFKHLATACPVQAGTLNVENAAYVLSLLDEAVDGIDKKIFSGVVTAPIHKGIINDSGVHFTGHTEYFAEKSHTKKVVMMLAGGGLKVALLTTHLPLKQVAEVISAELIEEVIQIVHRDLRSKFAIKQPRILVTGLNPHAGENGHLGREEIEIIIPSLEKLRQQGIDARGPFPADTVFQPFILQQGDVVLAMYHDQGLPVLKYASFGQGVNITLGLPFVRTSVDHGTALDLAGKGQANADSLFEAITMAAGMISYSYF